MGETDTIPKIIGKPVTNKVKTMLVDANGVDIEEMQNIINKQNKIIDDLYSVVKSRDAEDSEITRKLVCSKTAKWHIPFTYDELVKYQKDELDDLHQFICRVGKVNLSEIDETPAKTMYNAVRRFPKTPGADASGNYNKEVHKFSIADK